LREFPVFFRFFFEWLEFAETPLKQVAVSRAPEWTAKGAPPA
jgi:hypothetical protein